MDFSFIAHYFQEAFKNLEVSVTDEAYVYSSKNDQRKFALGVSKKLDYLIFDLERDDLKISQKLNFTEDGVYAKDTSESLASILVRVTQNLQSVDNWATKQFFVKLVPMNRTVFITSEFARLSGGQEHNYLVIEGEGNITYRPPRASLVIFSKDTSISVSDENWHENWHGDTPKLLKLIAWAFHGKKTGVSFEAWQKEPLKIFGLPEEKPEKKVDPYQDHKDRLSAIKHETRGLRPFAGFHVIKDTILWNVRNSQKRVVFDDDEVSHVLEGLLSAKGYRVTRNPGTRSVVVEW